MAERKEITVLFADVVGSMTLAETLDPESLRDVMHGLFNRSAAAVQRYQGTLERFTGDGLVALFGAPTALEDHALRAGICALQIQSEARTLSTEVRERHGIDLRVRIGINSGEVVTGEIGAGPASYTAVGHTVWMAQRMEAAAAPGSVLCTAATATLMGHSAVFDPVELVAIKGNSEPVAARRLTDVHPDDLVVGRDQGPMLGRDAELTALLGAFERQTSGATAVVGDPGVGKSRLVREFAERVIDDGAQFIAAKCDSHTVNIPLQSLTRLLRALFGTRGMDESTARTHVSNTFAEALSLTDADRAVLFDTLLIGDPEIPAPRMNHETRRQLLLKLLEKATRNRANRMVLVLEDVHWLDQASEEIIAEFAGSRHADGSMLIFTFRPQYRGRLRALADTTCVLEPLDGATTTDLVVEILGPDPTVREVVEKIAKPSAGNPFFVEEIIRDLVDREFLTGSRGGYRLIGSMKSVSVPTTIRSVLAARIDRLHPPDKSILSAASVIGSSFDIESLKALVPEVEADHLRAVVAAELIDQIQLLPQPRYAFRHPLVRAVSYESQLTTTRADAHRRLAMSIRARERGSAGENSAVIAHHLEAAGELEEAYEWFMRSAEWLRNRDVTATRDSWERACAVADALPEDLAGVASKRIAPRALLTFNAWQTGSATGSDRWFDELRELAETSGDSLALAMGLSGRVDVLIGSGRAPEASVVATELLQLIDAVPSTTSQRAEMLLSVAGARYVTGNFAETLRITERLCAMGPDVTVNERVAAMGMAGVIKVITGRGSQGRADLAEAVQLARADHPVTFASAVAWQTDLVIMGFALADAALVTQTRDALQAAESVGDAYALALARWAHGTALLKHDDSQRDIALDLLRQSCVAGSNGVASWCEADFAKELARLGRLDTAIHDLQTVVESDLASEDSMFVGYQAATLIHLLMQRMGPGDNDVAVAVIEQLETEARCTPAKRLWPLHCRAVVAGAIGDAAGHADAVVRYRAQAERLGAPGHLFMAEQIVVRPSIIDGSADS